ncbi:helix-turn-helix transcriptional regulator [Dermabacter hominis]|uniref:helix-turn-helix domain-containing protein n=1 Tax=Dermabacter hominis TaxID=36740 RepID=UPI002A43EE12|nr:helix-turn-helix domain-containing protein [Dermabacter hominis]
MSERDYASAVSAELRAIAARERVTGKELGERTGIPYTTLRRYLAGERDVPLAALIEMAAALDVLPGAILNTAMRRAEEDARPSKADFALAAHDAPNQGAKMRDALDTHQESPEPFYDGDEPA